jgi:sigma-B regulation protein RsbU (phosphoserine phosphatase)
MTWLDIYQNPRIPMIMELVSSMNRVAEPEDLLERFINTMRQAYGSRCYIQLSTRGLGVNRYRITRVLTHGDQDLIDRSALWHPEDHPIHQGGFLGEVVSMAGPSLVHNLELGGDPVLGEQLAPYRSAMACPLFENEIVNWVVLLDPGPQAFDAQDLEEMILRSNLVAAMVANLETARKLVSASLRIQREMEQIARIQEALLPEELPKIAGLRLAASYRTFDSAGGDLYDIWRLGESAQQWTGEPDERWALLIGDVSGHGPAAAVVMAMVHAILHTYPVRPVGPAEVLRHVNRHLCAKRIEQSFVTAFLAFYDPRTRELAYARAGHEPPVLRQFPDGGEPVRLDGVGELPLGIMAEVEYSEARVTLKAGQTLILYTDGITEAGRRGGEMFGIEGIERALVACTGAPDCAIRHIVEALERHQGEQRPSDDQTLVAVQVV